VLSPAIRNTQHATRNVQHEHEHALRVPCANVPGVVFVLLCPPPCCSLFWHWPVYLEDRSPAFALGERLFGKTQCDRTFFDNQPAIYDLQKPESEKVDHTTLTV
jgi:hypothetical protein